MSSPTGAKKTRSAAAVPTGRRSDRQDAGSATSAANGKSSPSDPPDRRAEILDAAAELFATKGVGNTTVRDIGKAVGMLSGSLYYYFDSKESMVAEILRNYLQARFDECKQIADEYPEPRARLAELVRTEFKEVDEHAWAAHIYQQEYRQLPTLPAEVRDAARGVQKYWLAAINDGVKQGVFRRDIDAEIFYVLARTSTNLAHHWVGALSEPYPLGKRHQTDDIAKDTIEILLSGFAVED